MQTRKSEPFLTRLYKGLKKFIVPVTLLSFAGVEFGKKYFGNSAALEDSDGATWSLSVGATFTLTILSIDPVLRIFFKDSPKEKKIDDTIALIDQDHHLGLENMISESNFDKKSLQLETKQDNWKDDDTSNLIPKKKCCQKYQNKSLRQCAGKSISFFFKIISLPNVIMVGIIQSNLGLVTIFSQALHLTREEFLEDSSIQSQISRSLTWILPIFVCIQYVSYTLRTGVFENADNIKVAMQEKKYNIKNSTFVLTTLVSTPCILASGPISYYYNKNGINNIKFLKNLFKNDKNLNIFSLIIGGCNVPSAGIILMPAAYQLLDDILTHGFKSLIKIPQSTSMLLKRLTYGLISNPLLLSEIFLVLGAICDGASNYFGALIGTNCVASDLGIGEITDLKLRNSTLSTQCPTAPWVNGCSHAVSVSTFLLCFAFSLRNINVLMEKLSNQNESKHTPTTDTESLATSDDIEDKKKKTISLHGPGRFSFLGERTQHLAVPLLLDTDNEINDKRTIELI